jgi:thiamine pyrophosphokinase
VAQEDLDVIIGDLDSLKPEVKHFYSALKTPAIVIQDPDQDSTDFGKAVSYIRKNYASNVDIVAVGSLGGRVDQGLSQLHHLYLFQDEPGYAAGRLYLVTNQSVTFLLKSGKHRIHVGGSAREVLGKYVGIIPIKEPSVITTRGLEWDVSDWETHFGGRISTSNHVRPDVDHVEVETTKDVIFTISLQTATA